MLGSLEHQSSEYRQTYVRIIVLVNSTSPLLTSCPDILDSFCQLCLIPQLSHCDFSVNSDEPFVSLAVTLPNLPPQWQLDWNKKKIIHPYIGTLLKNQAPFLFPWLFFYVYIKSPNPKKTKIRPHITGPEPHQHKTTTSKIKPKTTWGHNKKNNPGKI